MRRGRMVLQGAVVTGVGTASTSTDPGPGSPAHRQGRVVLGPGHPLFDPSSVSFWRFAIVGAAVAYVVGFHVSLGRVRIGLGAAGR